MSTTFEIDVQRDTDDHGREIFRATVTLWGYEIKSYEAEEKDYAVECVQRHAANHLRQLCR